MSFAIGEMRWLWFNAKMQWQPPQEVKKSAQLGLCAGVGFVRIGSRWCTLLMLALVTSATADIKIRPDDKMREKPKDFRKDTDKYGFPTPEPQSQEVKFIAGKSVDIVIEASTRYLGTVKFEIREQPRFGKLSALRTDPGGQLNKMAVTYTHNGNDDELSDRFSFVARLTEGSTSVPAVVTLKGVKSLPLLEVVENPRFKKVKPGDSDTARAVVKNSGTARFDSVLAWPAPFFGPPKLTIDPGQKQEFIIQVTPRVVGSSGLRMELQPGVASSTVKGLLECVLPYIVSPSSLELTYDAVSGQRKGSVKVTNASDSAMTLRLDPDARVKTVESLTIDAQQTVELALALEPQDVAAFRGEVSVVQEAQREKIFLTAKPEPAQPRLLAPADGVVDFGTVEKGKSSVASFTIINEGGEDLLFSATDAPPFTLVREGALKVPASSQAEFSLKFESDQGGKYEKPVKLSGAGAEVVLLAKGILNDPKRSSQPGLRGPGVENPQMDKRLPRRPSGASPRPTSAASPSADAEPLIVPASLSDGPTKLEAASPPEATPAPESSIAESPPDPQARPSVVKSLEKLSPMGKTVAAYASLFGYGQGDLAEFKSKTLTAVEKIGVLDRGRDYLTLGWKNPSVEPARYQIEAPMRLKGTATGVPVKTWKALHSWADAPAPEGMSAARVEGLTPGGSYEFRVVGVDSEGKLSPGSDIIMAATLPPLEIPLWVWGVTASLVVLGGLLVFKQRQNAR